MRSKIIEIEEGEGDDAYVLSYVVSHPDPETAWEIGIELGKLIAEPMAAMAQSGGEKGKALEVLPLAVRGLMNGVDSKSSLALIKKILSTVEVQSCEKADVRKLLLDSNGFKLHFRGRTGTMVKLLGEVIAFTHADFFSAIKDGIAKMTAKVE